MCVFTDTVEDVSNTNIFAALVGPKTQITVYSNKVALANSNAAKQFPTIFNSIFIPPQSQPIHHSNNIWWENTSGWKQHNPTPWATFNPNGGGQWYEPDGTPVAMVLAVPLPTNNADSIKMVDMSNCKDFFENLGNAFPKLQAMSAGDSYGYSRTTFSKNSAPL